MNDAYKELEGRFARIERIREAAGVLGWDQAVMMPEGGAVRRGEQLAELQTIAHELLTEPHTGELLESAAGRYLDPWQTANLREMRRRHAHATAVPAELVGAMARATTRCEVAWRKARAAADFPALLPLWREVLTLVREVAAAKASKLGLDPYDALLDSYDPGRRASDIDRIFGEVEGFLPDLLQRVLERQRSRPEPMTPQGPFPIPAQRAVAERLMRALGFDFTRGRLDISTHPFSSGNADDARITTRYTEDDFSGSLMGTLHETGHALYTMGLPSDWSTQPVGDDRGMATHESQSLIVEMQACRSRAFVSWLAPVLREAFAGSGPAWDADNLHRRLTRVAPGFIRVDADEVTYPAHVLLRYRLERQLIAGTLDLGDLPEAWGEGLFRLLGIRPPTDREGCLQDIHWPDGAFGYFPTYTLGAMTAAQLMAAARRDEPGLDDALAAGNFSPLTGWLHTHVHARGCFDETAEELLTAATGKPLDAGIFRQHLETRYLG